MLELRRSAAIIIKDKKIMLVRQKGKKYFNLPGSSPKENESIEDALQRGLSELDLKPKKFKFFNTFLGESSEDKNLYIIDTFLVIPEKYEPISKDFEVKWLNGKDLDNLEMHFLIKEQIIPELKRLKAID